jgi:lambda family phage portal protein
MDELDAGGRMHGHEMERLCKRQDVEAGECLLVKVMINDPNRYTPLAYSAYEPDWLSAVPEKVASGNQFDQGIEYDPKTGKVVAYHFAVPTGYGYPYMTGSMNVQRIPASYVIHNYEMLRPAQLRGISPFTTAILIAHDLGDYLDATMDVAKLSAKYLAMVETTDVPGFQNARSVNGTGVDQGKKLESVENAIIEYLRPGETIKFAKQDTMSDNFTPFTKFVLRMVAVATGVTYELLTSDYDGISYSNLRGIRNDFVTQIKPVQDRHIRHISQPLRLSIIDSAVQAGRIRLPGYQSNPYQYWQGAYTPPGMESPDPLREGKAWIEQIQYNLRSPQEVAAARGRSLEEILDECAEANRMMTDRGLSIGPVSTALQTNPAAVAPDTGGTNA